MNTPCSCETCVTVVKFLAMAQTDAQRGLDNTLSLGVAIALSNTYDPACQLPLNYSLPKDYSPKVATHCSCETCVAVTSFHEKGKMGLAGAAELAILLNEAYDPECRVPLHQRRMLLLL